MPWSFIKARALATRCSYSDLGAAATDCLPLACIECCAGVHAACAGGSAHGPAVHLDAFDVDLFDAVFECRYVFQGVAVDDDVVGQLAGLQAACPVVHPEQPGPL